MRLMGPDPGIFLGLCCLLLVVSACSQQKVETAEAPSRDQVASKSADREVSADSAKNDEPLPLPVVADGVTADRILVDKSDRLLILYDGEEEIARYAGIRFGDAPEGHKRFEGDEKTPEGDYVIDGRNPGSRFHLSLRISYPNRADRMYAEAHGKSPGGDIFIHGQPNGYSGPAIGRDWTDGCIAVSNEEIQQIWKLVPDGTRITIRP